MRLKTVFTRFYKSFNYDYLRKNHPTARPDPWDMIGDAFYPYVRVPIDPKITTVVGANESGKSHLLSAIEKGVSGTGIKSEDFCRYSQFFAVREGEIRTPDFGLEWFMLSESEKSKIRTICNVTGGADIDRFFLFRTSGGEATIYLDGPNGYTRHPVANAFPPEFLPRTFQINSQVALPESVSIRELIHGPDNASGTVAIGRTGRFALLDAFRGLVGHDGWFASAQTVQQSAAQIYPAMAPIARYLTESSAAVAKDREMKVAQVQLARDLIIKVARIAPQALEQLQSAIREGSDGHANGIVEKINAALAARLNFPRFWIQDRDFSLIVSPREYDLVFTIRDRTGTQYAFKERSSGLKFFLSYYIQYLAHEARPPETEILLMDEPDAYLSSQAQQDLLKVFAAYAMPEGSRPAVQVIYVTHSPFLIDKNHAHRIRVLEKGSGDEGTRVVRDVSRNHYEPLRSAFGAFVGETTFIGNCNLIVEGPADQVLLAGAAMHLRSRGAPESETLDLNRLTIVPAGSAAQIPYLVYLARGRDMERPAVIVLLDSDTAGNQAMKDLKRGGPRNRELLRPQYATQVGSLLDEDASIRTASGSAPVEIEDLVPLALCVAAARAYAAQFWGAERGLIDAITADAIKAKIKPGASIYDALTACVAALGSDMHIDKTGFARAVIDSLPLTAAEGGHQNPVSDEVVQFEVNMKALFRRLRHMQHASEREMGADRVANKVERLKRNFLQDHPDQATREQAALFLRDIEDALDESLESDAARDVARALKRDFSLGENILSLVGDFPSFKDKLEQLKYAGKLATQDVRQNQPIPEPVASGAGQSSTTL
jgi:predicted ATPase